MFSEARRTGLLGRVSSSLETIEATVPVRLRSHISSSMVEVAAFQRDVLKELDHIERALAGLGTPVLLLKGACYVRLGLKAAKGRIFSDVDREFHACLKKRTAAACLPRLRAQLGRTAPKRRPMRVE